MNYTLKVTASFLLFTSLFVAHAQAACTQADAVQAFSTDKGVSTFCTRDAPNGCDFTARAPDAANPAEAGMSWIVNGKAKGSSAAAAMPLFGRVAQDCTLAATNVTLELSDGGDAADAAKMHKAIDAMTHKVMECIHEKKGQPASCACMYPEELASVKNAYEEVTARHPGWKARPVYYTQADDSGVTVSFEGIRTQLAMSCNSKPE
ncbi:MAG: hypothetical protein GC185_12110 [Alphaproteobacteria bacterium]|nr:hypothetical protein [Alphaproteobacteria bacterium]